MDKELLRSKETKKVTIVGFFVNIFLTAVKLIAGFVGKSGAMIADGIHSLSDFLTDIIVIVGNKISNKPADKCHNYGHGKYETLSTVLISIFLAFVSVEIIYHSVGKVIDIIKGAVVEKPHYVALIAGFISIFSKEGLYQYTARAGKRIDSNILKANAWHHRSDALSSIGAVIGIGGAIILGNKWIILDPIASILVGFLVLKVAYDIIKPAISELMEKSLPMEDLEKIEKIIQKNKDVKGYHHLRTRKVAYSSIIEFHIWVDGDLSITKAHDISEHLEDELKKVFNKAVVTIHIEPYIER